MHKVFRFSFPFGVALLVLCAGLLLVDASAVSGQPNAEVQAALVVDTLDDELNSDGDCSLREAITAANTNTPQDTCGMGDVLTDTITFDVPGTINLNEQLSVTAGGPLVIDGAGAITLSGGGNVRVLYINNGAELALQSLAITGGKAADSNGGGIYNSGTLTITDSTLSGNNTAGDFGGGIYNTGTLTITDSTLSDNTATSMITAFGGGIYNTGTLNIDNSTLSGNAATYGSGGGIYNDGGGTLTITDSTLSGNTADNGGGIKNNGTLNITSSTLSGNSATQWGGGIANYGTLTIASSTLSGNTATDKGGGIFNYDTLTITSSTLSDNSAAVDGGGIYNSIYNYDGTLTITSSIVANSPNGGDCFAGAPITDGGHNLDSDDSCDFDWLPYTDPKLGPLHDNGGPTWTHALLGGSPAIDAGDTEQCPETDQRGFPRPVDGDVDGSPVCDIGSFEVSPVSMVVTTLVDELNDDDDCSLREAIQAANTNAPVDACGSGYMLTDTITFNVAGTITLNEQLSVTAGGPLVIEGADGITLSGGDSVRVLYVNVGAELTLQSLTITRGHVISDNGGGIFNSGTLTITGSTLSGNDAGWGGGIYIEWGTLNITNSTLSVNDATYWGGGIFNNYGTLTIAGSTLSGNTADYHGGGIYNTGTLTITNSTLSGNSAAVDGGGIFNDYDGTLTIADSTLSGNTATDEGGGIYNYGGTLTIASSIVANSPNGGDCFADEPITDDGHNLSSDDSCGFDYLPSTDPLLGPLQDNGGPTWTHALLEGSPAIDAGDNEQCPETDQRGFPRPVDGDKDGLAVCDIGAYEYSLPINYMLLIVKN